MVLAKSMLQAGSLKYHFWVRAIRAGQNETGSPLDQIPVCHEIPWDDILWILTWWSTPIKIGADKKGSINARDSKVQYVSITMFSVQDNKIIYYLVRPLALPNFNSAITA
jgi:hypothetical protein